MEVSWFQDLFGRLLDGNPRFLIRLANLETRWNEPRISDIPIDRPIYIAGLARSGSTLLLEILGSHPAVATHRYRDFPLVQIPLWWNWFIERAGGSTPRTRGTRPPGRYPYHLGQPGSHGGNPLDGIF
jgi:hypothetical protein